MPVPIGKPKLRVDAGYDFVRALEAVATQNFIYRSCINCENFNLTKEECRLCNLRPPASVIVFGCPKWADKDEIPF